VSGALSPAREAEYRRMAALEALSVAEALAMAGAVPRLLAALDASRAETAEARAEFAKACDWRDRFVTVVDEECGMQPVMSVDDLLTVLERHMFERRQSHENWRAFAEAADAVAEQMVYRCETREHGKVPGRQCPEIATRYGLRCAAHGGDSNEIAAAPLIRAWLAAKAAVGR